jgi:molybdopterin converting factor small subunit
MKKISIITLLSLISIQIFAYDYENFGKLPEEVIQKEQAEFIENLVASSRDLRKEMATFRNIASFTAEDEYWANEYEKLMEDNTEKDYLGMAEKL